MNDYDYPTPAGAEVLATAADLARPPLIRAAREESSRKRATD